MGRHPLRARAGRHSDHPLCAGAARQPFPRRDRVGGFHRQPVALTVGIEQQFRRVHFDRG